VRTFCQENDRDLAVRRNPISECADGVAIRPGGVPARLGGEEFLYMRSRAAVRRGAAAAARRCGEQRVHGRSPSSSARWSHRAMPEAANYSVPIGMFRILGASTVPIVISFVVFGLPHRGGEWRGPSRSNCGVRPPEAILNRGCGQLRIAPAARRSAMVGCPSMAIRRSSSARMARSWATTPSLPPTARA
jgi:hypothetical protein